MNVSSAHNAHFYFQLFSFFVIFFTFFSFSLFAYFHSLCSASISWFFRHYKLFFYIFSHSGFLFLACFCLYTFNGICSILSTFYCFLSFINYYLYISPFLLSLRPTTFLLFLWGILRFLSILCLLIHFFFEGKVTFYFLYFYLFFF